MNTIVRRTAIAMLLATLGTAGTLAGAQERVLRECQVTERALVDALAPPSASSPAEAVPRPRSFRPPVRPAPQAGSTATAGR